MSQRKTAGELSRKAASDTTSYKSMEVAIALTEDIASELQKCAENHCKIFKMEFFYVCYVIAGDPLIYNVMRRKFFALPFMPSPRPDQTVFLFHTAKQQFTKRLWTLPNAMTMATLSTMHRVDPQFRLMKYWSDCFYLPDFWQKIRDQHGLDHNYLSQKEFRECFPDIFNKLNPEFLSLHGQKLVEPASDQVQPGITNPFDFSKIAIKQIVDTKTAALV